MPDNQPKTLTCPSCGAPLEFNGKSAIVHCKFCRNVSVVPGFQPSEAAAPGLALEEIRRLADEGNLIEAIKQYRELYSVGLKEAKQAVEALQAGRLAEKAEDPSVLESIDADKALNEIRALLRAGNTNEAIHKYRELYDVSLTRAKYAVAQIESGRTFEPGSEYVPITYKHPNNYGKPTTYSQSTAQTNNRFGFILIAGILLFVGGIIVFALAQPGGPFVPRLFVNGPAILLPSEQDAIPDVAATLYDPDKETYRVGRVDSLKGRLLWKSDPLPEIGYTDAIVQGNDLVYVAHDVDLLAFHQTDGSPAWHTTMSDKLYTRESLVFSDGRVIAMGLDQMLQVFDAGTGRLVWSRQIRGYDRVIRPVGGALLSIDYIDDNNNFGMIFLDPASGSVQRTLSPLCQTNEYSSDSLRPDSGLLYDQAEHAFYLIYGFFNTCIQRIDAASGKVAWETKSDSSFSFSSNDFYPLNTQAALYFGSGNQLVSVDKSEGNIKILLENKDYEFLPLAADGDVLIVRARRARGTERFELWGVDRVSGERMWQYDFGKARPLDPPDKLSGLVDSAEYGWTWRQVPEGLVLIEFQAEPNQIALKTINTATGTALDIKTITLKKVSGDFYSVPEIIAWQGQIAYFKVDTNLYGFDILTGEIKFAY